MNQNISTSSNESQRKFSITRHYKIWFAISGVLIITSLAFIFAWGLRPGIEFRGGTLRDIEFQNTVSVDEIRSELEERGSNVVIQPVSGNRLIIKTEPQTQEEQDSLKGFLKERFGEFQEHSFEAIGPTIGRELVNRAYWQVILVTLGIVIYVTYSFRKIGAGAKQYKLSSWKLGFATIIALAHDIVIPLGFFAWLGKYYGVEIDGLFVTALLTILGFSVHDTIVVFDRIRESTQKFPDEALDKLIDHSVLSTFARSINTSSTLLFVLIASLLFGGGTVYYFVLTLLVGVAVGTYSSIFIASPILNLWHKR